MQSFVPQGTGVAIITPFRDGHIDEDALHRMIDYVIDGGVEYIVSLGTTGETTSLSDAEQEHVLRTTLAAVHHRVPVVAGPFGGNNTAQLCEKLQSFDPTGVAAILSSSPAYVKPSQEGIYAHYMQMAEASPLPIIIYNVPSRTSSNISADTIVRLANGSEKFIAVKDASADLVQGSFIVKGAPSRFSLLSGDDPTAIALISIGGRGVISVIANVFPKTFSDGIRAALSNDWDTARDLHMKLLSLHHWLYVEGNPVGIKEAAAYRRLIEGELRLPLVRMGEKNRAMLISEMEQLKSLG